ncbi:MAG: DUF5011 domain-containing protein, partial [Eggerthellaceae bacterium]|nr:DUF5011 domain-containing protein [Eggerthellaceae bacterium]
MKLIQDRKRGWVVMKARKNKRQPGFLRKTLAVVIAITMAVTLFVPLASFADPVVVAPGSDAVEYGDAALWQTPDASEPSAETANGGDDVDLPEDSVENNGVEVEGDFIPIMPLAGEPISIMPMGASSFGLEWDDVPAANRAGVSTWAEFCAAWDNTAISYIRLESDIARGTVATRPGLLDRDLVLDGNGKLLNVGTQTENVTLRLSTAANAPRDFTVKDINVVRQVPLGINARNVFIAVSDAASGATAGAGWSTWLAISAGPSSVTDNWTINMRNVVGEGIQRGELVHNINGTIYATGEIKWIHAVANTNAPSMSNTSDSYTCGTMNARMLTFDAADVWLETSSRSAPLRSAIHSTENRIEFIGGTKATLINHRQNVFSSTIQMGFNFDTGAAPGAAAVLATKVDLVFDGEGTEVNIQGRQIGWLDEAGMVNLGGGAGGVTVTNGAKVYAENIATAAGGPGALETGATASGPAFMQSIRANSFGDSYFIVDGEGSELHATSNVMRRDTDTYMHGVIWIRAGANAAVSTLTSCEFRVSNGGHINVLRKQEDGAGKSAGISFHGSNNRFTVESGGVVKVVNEGDTRNATGTDLRNSAVNFAGTDWGFYVKDEGSAVELYAERGAAVAGAHASGADTNNNNGEIVIEPGATIIMHGNVPNGAIVNGGTNFNFSFEEPRYYDFANFAPSTAAAPARVFRTNTASGVEFNSIHSDLAVWGNGTSRSSTTGSADSSMNPAGNPTWGVAASWSNPYMSWTLPTLTLTGQSFNGATFSSNNPLLTDAAGNFGNQGTQPYRRVQGNNATPRIDSMWEPATNADKYLRAIGSVPEGLDNVGRPIWTDEVYGRYEITRAADNSKEISKNGEVTSLIAEDIYEVETGVASLDGVVRYTDGDFLRAGDTFTMLSLWRGLDYPGDNANPEEVHMAKPEDMPGPITVIDILPPVPAEITMPNNGKLWQNLTTEVSGSWLPEAAQAAAEPHNPDPAVKLYAVLKSGGSTTTISEGGNPVEGVLNADGTWLYTFPDSVISSLALNDEVYFVLEDAEGNANPLVDTPCHDTTLLAAPHLTVQAPELTLSHEDQVIGLRQATEIADLGTDSAPQYAALKDLINARADKLYPAVTLDTAVSVNKVTPPWDSPAYYDLEDFKASNPDGKTYAVRYAADADTSIYKSGSVKVEPYIEAKKYIAANDFDITVSNATTLMNKSTADRDTELIALAEAVGRLNITDPWNASLVRVASVAIPNPAEAGDWDVTFYINGQPQDYDHTVTIKAHVTSGNTPVILVDAPINVWLGDATEPFMAAGGERPDGSILPSEVDYMDGVSAFYAADSNVDITGDVTYDDSAVDLTKKGIYPVTYSVTNSDGNDATATRPVLVGDFVVIDGYIIDATSFVKERSEANAATILDDAQAYAWEMDLSEPSGLKDATPMVVSAGTYGAGSPVGTYPIRIGVVGAPSNVYRDIEAVLVDKDQMTDAVDPDTNIRYIIGANDVTNLMVSEAADYAGLSDAAQLKLINASEAEAWRLMSKAVSLGTGFPVTSLADAGVYVVSNDIPATGGSHGQSYKVTFAITSVPSITVDVTYTLFGAGPVIAFQEEPLVIDFQSGSDAHNLTFAEITDQMTATDYAARSILNPTDVTYTINGSPTAQINTGNVGVYKVVYTATDDNGMTATATRAIIIDDGRFEIDTDNDVIIGAKNFVATSASVNGSMGQVLSWSRAVAYDIEGNTIDQSNLTIDPFPPTGYTTNAPAGTYDFTWTVVGKPTKKTIKGVITDADVIYEGGENDQYAITANHFQVNATRAAEMIASGLNDALIMEADVQVIKLVDAAPTATPRVVSNGGFTDTQDTYDLTFGAQVGTTPVITSPSPTQVMSKGIVSDGFPPELTVSTPVEIWIGDGPTPAGSITPAQYTSDDMYGVSATDVEDDAAGIPLDVVVTYLNPATGVDVTTPGMYTLRYSVEDSDGNAATADRVVVVNDGSYTVGDGRILYAKSFVTRLADVTTNPSMIESEILSKSGTKLYNGTTGAEIGLTGNLTGIMSGGYSYAAGAGVYNITINAADAPTGTISKSITGEIVDADVVGPVPAPEFGPVTYVFGSNAKQTVLEAEDTAALGAAGVLAVLEATASKYLANGNKVSPSPAVKILQDKDNYLSTFTTGDSAMGIYHFLVSDVDEETTIELNIQVGSGFDDLFIEATPKPLVVNMPVPASAVDGSGNLTRDKLMEGVVATDVKAEGAGNPTGDVRSQVVIDILDMSGGGSGSPVSAIPADVPGLYQV